MKYIDPIKELGSLLLTIEKPARYVGGEFGILANKQKTENAFLKTVIAFPDLYEIGMGNHALKIIYNKLNAINGVCCDRAFAPAPDFEKLLRKNNIPLYGLDSGIALSCVDLLLFTLGYELGLGGVLLTLEASDIPLRCNERNENYPIVIAGGPAVSNPLPFSHFIDAFWIGEAEAGFFELADVLAQMKKNGQGRDALLSKIAEHPNIWVKGKTKTKRAVYNGFSSNDKSYVFPVPSMKIVQNHGTVEIMRGCPNGCRFCAAGFWYRPMRQKYIEKVINEAQQLVIKGGWQQISLSSLSSGDYCGVSQLLDILNEKFKGQHVSFQMPSLKVSGFSLDLLEKISVTRKSGLTFAVETPRDLWQMAINKTVTRESVVAILEEAKKRGYKSAKFYFMVGLPLKSLSQRRRDAEIEEFREEEEIVDNKQTPEFNEEQEIVNFIIDISKQTRMKFNINVGVFIPKAHTPYQWVRQISTEEAKEKLYYIKNNLKPYGHKVSTSDLLISRIEGLLSRGDERAGELFEEAYNAGSRLDAWNEYINREKWNDILNKNEEEYGPTNAYLRYGTNWHELKWSCIESGVTKEYFQCEQEKSDNSRLTPQCSENCTKCGICNHNTKIIKNSPRLCVSARDSSFANPIKTKVNQSDPGIYRVLFSFSKTGSTVFHGHLSLIEMFSMSLRRAGIPVKYTLGFNPLAKLEFASPLSTGVSSEGEIAAADFEQKMDPLEFMEKLNLCLPQGLVVTQTECFYIPGGTKKHSLAGLLWGFAYINRENQIDYIEAKQEKAYRQERLNADCKTILDLKRIEVLAKDKKTYFETYRVLY